MNILLCIYFFKKVVQKKNMESLFILSFFPVVILINLSSVRISIGQLALVFSFIYLYLKKFQNNKQIKLGNKGYLFFLLYIITTGFINYVKVNPNLLIITQSSKVSIFSKASMVDFYKHIILISFSYCGYLIAYNYFFQKKSLKFLENMFKKITWILLILSLIQLLSGIIKFPYDRIFRQHPSTLYQTTKLFGLKIIRLAPTTPEPSIYSVILIFILSFFIFHNKKNIKYKIIILSLGLISTSSTFIVGLLILVLFYLIKQGINNSFGKNLLILLILLVVGIVVYKFGFFNSLIDKINGKGISGSVRLRNLNINLNIFYENILLGIGFGRSKSEDLLSTWLANIGILGYIFFVNSLIQSTLKAPKIYKKYYSIIYIYFFQCLISVSEPYYFFTWLVLGILDGSSKRRNRNEKT